MALRTQVTGHDLLLVLVIHHKIGLGHRHGPLGYRCRGDGRVEVHMTQGLTHRLPGVLPCGDFFYVIEEVSLPGGREGHLPPGGQRQLVGHVVGLLAEVRVLLRGAPGGARTGAQLQGCGRRVRADVLRAACQPRPGVAARRVGAGLARVRARVGLLEEGLRQDLFPPGAGLGVHDRVEEGFEVRVEVLRDVDDLLPWRREPRGHRGRIHLSGHAGKPSLGASRACELEPGPVRQILSGFPAAEKFGLSHPRSWPRALALCEEEAAAAAAEEEEEEETTTQTSAAAKAPGLSHKQSLQRTPTPRKEAGREWSC